MSDKSKNFGLLSLGVALPETRKSVTSIAQEAGYDPDFLQQALELIEKPVATKDDEHPSDLATQAAQKAIDALGISPSEIGLVIYTGLSRDYLPAWNIAIEVIRRLQLPNAMGFELTLGCVGPLLGIQHAKNRGEDGRPPYTLVVTAERWTHTLSKNKETPTAVLGHADGAAACIVGPGSSHVVEFNPYYKVVPEFNDSVMIPAGGTKHPPSQETIDNNMHIKVSKKWDMKGLVSRYVKAYNEVIEESLAKYDKGLADMTLLLTNQVPSLIRHKLIRSLKLSKQMTVNTYPYSGHVGGADTLIGLDQAIRNGQLKKGMTVFVASTFSAFGALAVRSESDSGIAIVEESSFSQKVA